MENTEKALEPRPDLVDRIRANLEEVTGRIHAAAQSAGRDPSDIRLVVVTKSQPVEVLQAAIRAGAMRLGENYAEEAVAKMEQLKDIQAIQWHMIGHVQSRKARLVCEHFALVHSLDSYRLAVKYDAAAGEMDLILPVLIEVNLGGEETKSGYPAWNDAGWEDLLPEIERLSELTHIRIHGLMSMPPMGTEAEESRPYFIRLRRLQDFLKKNSPNNHWRELSIGTSYDYEVAIQEGATYVRIGQAIVGPRPKMA